MAGALPIRRLILRRIERGEVRISQSYHRSPYLQNTCFGVLRRHKQDGPAQRDHERGAKRRGEMVRPARFELTTF
jgi:hypothetical protein